MPAPAEPALAPADADLRIGLGVVLHDIGRLREAAAQYRQAAALRPWDGDPLLRYRDRFPILGTTNYQISNSLGAMPGAVAGRMSTAAERLASALAFAKAP